MAQEVMIGWELGQTPGLEWNGGISTLLSGISANVESVVVRTGNFAMRIGATSGGQISYAHHLMSAPRQEIFARVAWRASAFVGSLSSPLPIMTYRPDTDDNHLTVSINTTTQRLELYRGNTGGMGQTGNGTLLGAGTLILENNVWYVIELRGKIHDVNGEAVVRVNGMTDIGFSGNTAATAEHAIHVVRIGAQAGGSAGRNYYFDDFAINDTLGDVNNSWVGPGGIILRKMVGDGVHNEWARSVGSDGYPLVADAPIDKSTYVTATNVGDRQLFTLEPMPAEVTSVRSIQVVGQATLAEAGQNAVLDLVRQGVTDYQGPTTQVVSVEPDFVVFKGQVYETFPNGDPFYVAGVNDLQVGMEIGVVP